ncbi:hypothetical protein [Pelagicoccus sp. SDUM812002]|uniref:hypothetical protein n=1 Tax=Pelagicoccus sp. SDUM812002 TaxID=3041266 RepID=UPI00280DCA07|nr:hypothetical protein [Pelagicoccus sp. SDUM812002]MDQ8187999.1 hypothetical protein [Pelagicoccus sp. SDUM812002]
MSAEPVICFGQQPCGFFPKRFLVSKIWTARRLQKEIGGEIVFFYHDCDHDPRETQTKLKHLKTGELHSLNFAFENKIQKKYTPLFAKRVDRDWQANTARQLPQFVSEDMAELFSSIQEDCVADFCLAMYRGMGLLEGMRIERSGSAEFRCKAISVDDYFVDTFLDGELVRARKHGDGFALHRGGSSYLPVEADPSDKGKVTPTRDTRLRWMQSVLKCTHYIAGAGEIKYLNKDEAPEIEFIERDPIECSDEAYVGE